MTNFDALTTFCEHDSLVRGHFGLGRSAQISVLSHYAKMNMSLNLRREMILTTETTFDGASFDHIQVVTAL